MTHTPPASWINQRRLDLACGLSLLTRLPAGWLAPAASRTSTTPWPLARSVWCWPVIAMLIGAVTGCVLALLRMAHVPALAAAALALTCQTILTGGLHEDGLADMADGCGGATPDRRLAIMRDSRVGSYGVMALGLGLLVRVSALAALPVQACILVCATAACLARMAMVFVPILIPPARPDGLARALSARPVWSFLAAVLMASGVALGLPMVGRNMGVTFPLPLLSALLPGGVSYATALLVALCAKRQLGGYTGDVLGCCAVVAECLLLCLYAALLCP